MPQEFECPECGNTYDTKRGLHIHIGQKHPDRKEEILSELESEGEEWAEEEEIEKETEEAEEMGPEEEVMDIEIVKNPWKIVSIVLLILLIGSVYFWFQGAPEKRAVEGKLGPEEAANKAVNYINQNLLRQGKAELVSVNETNGLYSLKLDISGRQFNSYLTKDGQLLFPQAVELKEVQEQEGPAQQQEEQTQQEEVPKTETPTAQLFVMAFCPYGNRAELTMEPVFELLGDSVNWEPHYIVSEQNGEIRSLHGSKEVEQDKREVCVLENYDLSKWFDFVTYVNKNCGSDGNCWKEAATSAGLDAAQISSCAEERGTQLLKEEAQIANKKGATGSPTLFINGKKSRVVYQYGNSEAYKDALCSAFTEKPDACNQELQSTSSGSSSSGGQC